MNGSNTSVEFRELRRRDVPTFVPVILQGMGALERGLGLEQSAIEGVSQIRRPAVWVLLRFLQLVRVNPVRLLVAVEGGRVVGTAAVFFVGNAGYIGGVATDAAARGRGIGTRIMELAQSVIRAHKKPWLALDVESENETAIRLYARLGYREVARYDWYVGVAPSRIPDPGGEVREIGPRDKEARDWVGQRLPTAVRDVFPPQGHRLTHLELFTRPSRAVTKTWRSEAGGGGQGVVRAYFGPKSKTGFLYPLGADPSQPEGALLSLVAPALAWLRSLGVRRIVLGVVEPAGGWSAATSALGLTKAVSSTLMVRAA